MKCQRRTLIGTGLLSMLVWEACLTAQTSGGAPCSLPMVKGYETKLTLDGPILAGPARAIAGRGAPTGSGIWVELWRVPPSGARAESVGSVAARNGAFSFGSIAVAAGDAFYATLSRSWRFGTEGDLEGWNRSTNDVALTVANGVLEIELENLDGDAFLDAWIETAFTFDPRYYRVLEVRLLNTARSETFDSLLGIFWASPGPTPPSPRRISEHNAQIPGEMEGFQTIQIPMNVGETRILPSPAKDGLDGLWDQGVLNDSLRLDPLNNIPPNDRSMDGAIFLIDTIRIREDYRREFHQPGDRESLTSFADMAEVEAADGFLSYVASDVGSALDPAEDGFVRPQFASGLQIGRLDTRYFTRFAVGLDSDRVTPDPLLLGILFDDQDSVAYRDDGGAGALQEGSFAIPPLGRRDEVLPMGALTKNEWSEDGGRVLIHSLRLACPQNAVEGDRVRLDYFGWIPETPFGPSELVLAETAFPQGPPTVDLGFAGPCSQEAQGEAGSIYSSTVDCVLTTVKNPLGEGAAGWSISLQAEGVRITDITTRGTVAAGVADDPPGLRNDGYQKLELTTGAGNEGAVCAVVLSNSLPVTLPPLGSAAIARIRLEGVFPSAGGCQAARVRYAHGNRGSGRPVCNVVTFRGNSVLPALGECAFQLCPAAGPGNRWPTYDCNDDGGLDVSDAVCHLNYLFLGGRTPPCLEALDFNGDLGGDVSDPVAALTYLFLGGNPPPRGVGCRISPSCARGFSCR